MKSFKNYPIPLTEGKKQPVVSSQSSNEVKYSPSQNKFSSL
jgi:hypothetical protein